MIKFLMIEVDNIRRLINIDYIEEIREIDENSCCIYMAFNCPNATDQDYFVVQKSFDEITSAIRGRVVYAQN